jgi:hypothetical protein
LTRVFARPTEIRRVWGLGPQDHWIASGTPVSVEIGLQRRLLPIDLGGLVEAGDAVAHDDMAGT